MYPIADYTEARTLEEAIEQLSSNPGLLIIAGGTDLLIKLYHGKLDTVQLLSLRQIKSLQIITENGDGSISIGSLSTFKEIGGHPIVQQGIPILAEAAMAMGGPQIRSMATIGGNICNGIPSADSAPALFALNAILKLQSKEGERAIPIQEFYRGPGQVDLKQGELLTEILITPDNYQHFGGCYIKFSMRKAMDIATLGVAATCKLNGTARFGQVRIGLGVAGPTPLRCTLAEEYAVGKAVNGLTIAEIGKIAVQSAKSRTSWRASKEYREHLIEELTQRALTTAITRAGGVIDYA
ncbi:MAG TPA: xanthine dehydrogenase subunit XdhB [Candidatus Limnocylindrales bacterium]|nr:xanthine dehydrogenase subunit XdhB [Candidatus Limnocylindrales bacterium]